MWWPCSDIQHFPWTSEGSTAHLIGRKAAHNKPRFWERKMRQHTWLSPMPESVFSQITTKTNENQGLVQLAHFFKNRFAYQRSWEPPHNHSVTLSISSFPALLGTTMVDYNFFTSVAPSFAWLLRHLNMIGPRTTYRFDLTFIIKIFCLSSPRFLNSGFWKMLVLRGFSWSLVTISNSLF